jgi:Uma2 family endonuclease
MVAEVRRITVTEYHRMAEAGILRADERVELIAGQIVPMAAKGSPHSAALTRTDRILRSQLGDLALIRLQYPVQLDDYSEPEPDIAVVRPDPLDYEVHHPTASDVFLILEIADSTLKYDREVEAPAYARSAIKDYWVLDVAGKKLHIYRRPDLNGYQSETILAAEVEIAPLAFSGCLITVKDMLSARLA